MPERVDRATFRRLFETFEHTAWRLETRRGYASDRQDPDFQAFLANGSSPCDPDEPWFVTIKAQTDAGKTVGRVRVADAPPTTEQLFLLDYARHNAPSARTSGICGARTPSVSACPPRTSGSSIHGWSPSCTSMARTICSTSS